MASNVIREGGQWTVDNTMRTITVPLRDFAAGPEDLVALLIVKNGLMSSLPSHGVIGALTSSSPEYSVQWGVTPLDFLEASF